GRPRRPRHDALGRERRSLPGGVRRGEARGARPRLRGLPRQRRARIGALPRQHGPPAPAAGDERGPRPRRGGVRAPPRAGTLAGRVPRARVSPPRSPLPRDGRDADALPRAPLVMLHRLVGQRLPVHDLRPADREPARRRLRPRPPLERARGPDAAARDLAVALPELLDALRGVPEHPRQRAPPPAAGIRATAHRRADTVAVTAARPSPCIRTPAVLPEATRVRAASG